MTDTKNFHPFTPAEVKALEKACNIIARKKEVKETFTIGKLSGDGRYLSGRGGTHYDPSSAKPADLIPFEDALNKVFAPPPPKPLTADELAAKIKAAYPEIDVDALNVRD